MGGRAAGLRQSRLTRARSEAPRRGLDRRHAEPPRCRQSDRVPTATPPAAEPSKPPSGRGRRCRRAAEAADAAERPKPPMPPSGGSRRAAERPKPPMPTSGRSRRCRRAAEAADAAEPPMTPMPPSRRCRRAAEAAEAAEGLADFSLRAHSARESALQGATGPLDRSLQPRAHRAHAPETGRDGQRARPRDHWAAALCLTRFS